MSGGINGIEPLFEFVVEHIQAGVFAVDADLRIVMWNRFMAMHSNRCADDVIGKPFFECFPELPAKWLEKKFRNVFILKNYAFTSWEQRPYLFRFDHNRPITGGIDAMQQNCTFLPVKGADNEVKYVCVTLFDYTDSAIYQQQLSRSIADLEREREEQKRLIAKLEEAQNQLLQSEKLASIGQLAAGVAHEINNPIGFVNSNLGTLDNYVRDLLRLLDACDAVRAGQPALAEAFKPVESLRQEMDFEFVREDIGSLLRESMDGLDRVKKIVQDLKDFSHVDSELVWQWADLHKCLDSTLNVVHNEVKYKADVVKNYGDLGEVECMPSQLNQVFMNLLVNAAHAIADRGTITLSTGVERDWAWVAVGDTGCGIAPEQLKRIFDPFFTTKPVGKGTGLGLSVSHNVIAKHGGRIEVESTLGAGTTFRVWLPLRQPQREAA